MADKGQVRDLCGRELVAEAEQQVEPRNIRIFGRKEPRGDVSVRGARGLSWPGKRPEARARAPVGLEGWRAAAPGGVHPVLVGVDELEVRLLADGLGGVEEGVGREAGVAGQEREVRGGGAVGGGVERADTVGVAGVDDGLRARLGGECGGELGLRCTAEDKARFPVHIELGGERGDEALQLLAATAGGVDQQEETWATSLERARTRAATPAGAGEAVGLLPGGVGIGGGGTRSARPTGASTRKCSRVSLAAAKSGLSGPMARRGAGRRRRVRGRFPGELVGELGQRAFCCSQVFLVTRRTQTSGAKRPSSSRRF
jgi:hypothetical protein